METNSYNTDNILSDPFSSLATTTTTEDDVDQKTSSLGFMEMLGFQDYYYFDNTTTYQQQLPPLPPPPTSSLSMAVELHTSAAHQDDDRMDNQDEFTTVDEETSVVLNGQPSSPNNSSSICTSPAHQRLHKPQCIKEKKAMSGDEMIKAKKKKKEKSPRFAFMTRTDIDHLDDGYRWRKYGQKAVKNSRFPRSYYRCTSASCNVKKRVERCMSDPSYVITTYEGQHNHPVALNCTPLIPSYNNYITNAAFAATAATTVTTPTPPAMLKLEQGGLLQDILPCYH